MVGIAIDFDRARHAPRLPETPAAAAFERQLRSLGESPGFGRFGPGGSPRHDFGNPTSVALDANKLLEGMAGALLLLAQSGLQQLLQAPPQAPPNGGSIAGLLDTQGLSEPQKYAVYAPLLDQQGQDQLAQGRRVVLALRQDATGAGGQDAYGDRVVVLWRDGQGGHAEELRANTRPPLPDGHADPGQLTPGSYIFDRIGDQRGTFCGNDYSPLTGSDPLGGYHLGQHDTGQHDTGQHDTGPTGCQTMPPEDFVRLQELLGWQPSFLYQLQDVSGGNTASQPRGGGGSPGAAAGDSIAGLSSEGMDFILEKEGGLTPQGKVLIEHPSAASGVTIVGYDMSGKSKDTIRRDLLGAGASPEIAARLAEGAGLIGAQADAFVSANKHLLDDKDKTFALRLIAPELGEVAHTVDQAAAGGGVTLTTRQRDALISYVLNVGPGQFTRGSAGQALQRGDLAGVAEGLLHGITKSGGEVMAGLVTRREQEAQMFRTA